jgi:hypothetical protein
MSIFTYLYNKFFINNNKINIEHDNKINIEDIKKKSLIKYDIYNNICDMKQLREDEMSSIKKMSHGSLVQLIGLLSNVNTSIITLLNDDEYIKVDKEKPDNIINSEKT